MTYGELSEIVGFMLRKSPRQIDIIALEKATEILDTSESIDEMLKKILLLNDQLRTLTIIEIARLLAGDDCVKIALVA